MQNRPKFSCVARVNVRVLHGDWSIKLGEYTSDQTFEHLAAVLRRIYTFPWFL